MIPRPFAYLAWEWSYVWEHFGSVSLGFGRFAVQRLRVVIHVGVV